MDRVPIRARDHCGSRLDPMSLQAECDHLVIGIEHVQPHLTATFGVPFAFAGQFAPQMMLEAIGLYREYFKPSVTLSEPYVMVGLPVLAADTDEQTQQLATSVQQRVLRLIRDQPIYTPPPVASMKGRWNSAKQQAVEAHLGAAMIGGPATIKQKLSEFLKSTGANELILHSDFYRLKDRLRPYEIMTNLL